MYHELSSRTIRDRAVPDKIVSDFYTKLLRALDRLGTHFCIWLYIFHYILKMKETVTTESSEIEKTINSVE